MTSRMAAESSLRGDIEAANQRFTSAFARGDTAGLAACYGAEGQVLPPNGEVVQGRAAIEGFWRMVLDAGISEVRLETAEVEGDGGSAYEVGRYTLTAGGGQVADRGKYVVIWRREGGEWKLHRDIWNSSVPAPAPA